jgi:hypothetical protein
MFITALFTIAKLWKHPRCPITDEWIKNMCYVYTIEFHSATKRMKLCHLQVNGWNWRISSQVKLAKFRKPKVSHLFSLICGI